MPIRKTVIGRRNIPEPAPAQYQAPSPRTQEAAAALLFERRKLQIRDQADAEKLVHQDYNGCINMEGRIVNPGALGNFELVGYTIPNGNVAQIFDVAVLFSDPTVATAGLVGWRILVNGERPPNIGESSGNEYYFHSFGSLEQPYNLHRLYIQTGARITITITVFIVPPAVTIIGRLAGELLKPANPNLIQASR